jgi:hypothetical protein
MAMSSSSEKITSYQKAVIAGSIIGTILSEYKGRDRSNEVRKIQSSIHDAMNRYAYVHIGAMKCPNQSYIDAVGIANKVWVRTVNHFSGKGVSVSVVFAVLSLFSMYGDDLVSQGFVTQDMIDKYTESELWDDIEKEGETNKVFDFMIDSLREETGEQVPGHIGALKRIAAEAKARKALREKDKVLSL